MSALDFSSQLRILREAQGNTALLAFAMVDIAHASREESARNRIKNALLASAVPHWVDEDILAALLDVSSKESASLLRDLRVLTIVESFPSRGEHAVNIHADSRLAIRDYLRVSHPELWRIVSERAMRCAQRFADSSSRVEATYHMFAVDQQLGAAWCETLRHELFSAGRHEGYEALGVALRELIQADWLKGAAKVQAQLVPIEVRILRESLPGVEEKLRETLRLARDVGDLVGVCDSLHLLGIVLKAAGDMEGAAAAISECYEVAHRFSKRSPEDRGWLRRFAIATSKSAELRELQGEHKSAVLLLKESLDLLKHLSTPSLAVGPVRDLVHAANQLGDMLLAQGNLEGALAHFAEATRLTRGIVEREPLNAGCLLDLSSSLTRMGDVFEEQGQLVQAKAAYAEAATMIRQLADEDESNTGRQRTLAIALSRVGGVHEKQGDLESALLAFEECSRIARALIADDPANLAAVRMDNYASVRAGEIFEARGDFAAALRSYLSVRDSWLLLAELTPSDLSLQRQLAVAHSRVGDAHLSQREFMQAHEEFLRGLEISKRLVSRDGEHGEWLGGLGFAHSRMASVNNAQGDAAGALDESKLSLAAFKRQVQASPTSAEGKRNLAEAYSNLAHVYKDLGQTELARSSLVDAIQSMSKALATGNANPSWIAALDDLEKRYSGLQG
jgi:tetratricopeptide (TPR) repeat protein